MTERIPLAVSTDAHVDLRVGGLGSVPLRADPAVQIVDGEHYQGVYRLTPSPEEQTLPTAGLVMDQDVTVEAIPQQYGLITWDGTVLTVS